MNYQESMFAEIEKRNEAKADACPEHCFENDYVSYTGQTCCRNCGAMFSYLEVRGYLRGFQDGKRALERMLCDV